MTVYLEPEDALAAAVHLGFHIRDEGLLFSALARPAASAFGVDAYPELERKAAALLHSLARNHPLFDGNKRFAWYLTLAFLRLNEQRVVMPTDTAFDLVLGVARGDFELDAAASVIRAHLVPRR
ncbi:MAG: type II toxin-antitoxin system death-on-curing family toxin [Pseudolysinimonas sp.]|uniref:type II toxin-antitoxin system death-on-curing family toxin n=1 Tax=Pseudolysinimonas sp. TaxID=2680009 RepID=UPI003C73FE64